MPLFQFLRHILLIFILVVYRELAVFTANQWIVLLIGEGLCSLFMILVITNTFNPIETHLRSLLLKSSGNNQQSSSSSSASAATPSFASPVSISQGAMLQLTTNKNSSLMPREQQSLLSHGSGIRNVSGSLGFSNNSDSNSRRGGYDAISQQQDGSVI